jgi:hypothetical protein
VMKGFPIGTILVPIESSPNRILANVKVVTQSIRNGLNRGTTRGIFANEMGSLMPGNPFGSLDRSGGLKISNLLNQLIIHGPIVFGTK